MGFFKLSELFNKGELNLVDAKLTLGDGFCQL